MVNWFGAVSQTGLSHAVDASISTTIFTFSEKESKRKTEEGPTKRRAGLPTSSH